MSTQLYRPMSGSQQRQAPALLTDQQKDSVAYFFMRLKVSDPQQYDVLMPDETTEIFVKREYARQVCDFSREKIDQGFKLFHQMRQSGDPDYRFLKIDSVIGLMVHGAVGEGNPAGIHKYFNPEELIEDQGAKERAKEAGESELAKMRGMFDL